MIGIAAPAVATVGATATVGGAAGGLAARGVVGGLAPKALKPMLGKHKNPAYNGMLDIGLDIRCMQHEHLYSRLYMS